MGNLSIFKCWKLHIKKRRNHNSHCVGQNKHWCTLGASAATELQAPQVPSLHLPHAHSDCSIPRALHEDRPLGSEPAGSPAMAPSLEVSISQ